jgi:iron complex transport system substrate-binding protein
VKAQDPNLDFTPRRVVCLQPSATSTLDALGLLDRLVACTRWCIDIAASLKNRDKTILADSWTAQAEEIIAARPDLVIASVPYQTEALAEILKSGARFLGLAPKSLAEVFSDIAAIAGVMGVPERGRRLIAQIQNEIDSVAATAGNRPANSAAPRVHCEEWGKPLIHSQRWVAELVEAAGGEFIGEPGKQTDPETIRRADPDIIIAAWCGAGDRVPLEKIVHQRGWSNLRAVEQDRVYCLSDELLNTPGPTLIAGLRALAHVISPGAFPQPRGVRRINQLVVK